jgi:hypothetical protein
MFLGTAWRLSYIEVELLIGCGGVKSYQIQINSECYIIYAGVRLWVLRSRAERERTQTIS